MIGVLKQDDASIGQASGAATDDRLRGGTSTDNPYSEAQFKTLKYRPGFPARFDSIEHARAHCREFFDDYNHSHRHSGIGLMTPATVHHGQAKALHADRARVLAAAYAANPRALRPPTTNTARTSHRRVDQQARHPGGRSLNSAPNRLKRLDRLRSRLVPDGNSVCSHI